MVLIRIMMEKFQYYKKPDGHDPINKIMGVTKYGLLTATFCTIYDANVISRCSNTLQFLNTAGYWFVPITSMCVAFATVTYVATNVRNKDDSINYVLGALTSGAIMHTWLRNFYLSGTGTFLFVSYALLKKHMLKRCPELNPILPNPENVDRWHLPWRYLESRNYNPKPRWEFDREDYYRNFN